MNTIWYDTVSTLSWLAGITHNVRLLSNVYILPYRHPLATAKAFSTLDALSAGRTILGVGAGHAAGEFAALGIPLSERGRRTNAAIDSLRALFADEWGGGEVGQRPRPVQPGGPPIWVGGSSTAALRRAAERGDGWIPQGPPEGGMASAIDELKRRRDLCGRLDLSFAINERATVYVGEPRFLVPDGVLVGPPDKLADALARFTSLGVTHVHVRFASRTAAEHLEQVERFAREVMPAFHSG
jgi:alkanesulfonate monooxygenase SsuD/methylene tetrahydromethanopterin reductase-like flavin-dependent oxidoreductase (luciferase family)